MSHQICLKDVDYREGDFLLAGCFMRGGYKRLCAIHEDHKTSFRVYRGDEILHETRSIEDAIDTYNSI